MDTEYIDLPTELMQLITPEQAWHYSIIPKSQHNGNIEFYCGMDSDIPEKIEELEMIFSKKVSLHKTPDNILRNSLARHYIRVSKDDLVKDNVHSSPLSSISLKTKDFLNSLIQEACNIKCSDIHIERYEAICRIRFRIDGKLFERFNIPQEDYPAIVNKIKISANLDIAEKRLPQDGRMIFTGTNQTCDIRVSVIPGLFGEKIVMRLLNQTSTEISIYDLGFSKKQMDDYLESIKRPNGIILISGPTGSGKTTTLYATLNLLNNSDVNILTIEDPIEYTIIGINQVQLKENIGLTFGRALKTFLRQDPDIIMVGEVRDTETGQMAIRAALTGHLVFSSIHTNSAWGIVSRLIDMGLPSFLLASTLNAAVAQRLVRKLCPKCRKEENEIPGSMPETLLKGITGYTRYYAVGCDLCHMSGYKGRIAIFEVINIDNELRRMIHDSIVDAGETLKKKEIRTLQDSAIELYKKGITSFEEIYPLLISNF